jgi:hypothetical protein
MLKVLAPLLLMNLEVYLKDTVSILQTIIPTYT